MKVYASLVLVLFLTGCATTQSVRLDERQHTYQAPYNRVFEAFVEHFAAQGYGIADMDRGEGFITTDYRQFVNEWGHPRRKVSTVLKVQGEEETEVVVTITEETQGEGGNWDSRRRSGRSARALYDRVFTAVEQILEETPQQ